MKNYFKVVQVCEHDNLTNCFPKKFTATWTYQNDDGSIKDSGSKSFSTTNLSTTKSLVEKSNYDTDIVGIKFSDGTSMLITYNTNCIGIESGDTDGNTSSCFGYIADINTTKAPNQTEKDIVTNMALVHQFNLDFDIIDNKLIPQSRVYSDIGYIYDESIIPTQWGSNYYCQNGNNYYKRIIEYCEKQGGRLPDMAEVDQISQTMYGKTNSGTYNEDDVIASPLWQVLNGTSSTGFSIWTTEPYVIGPTTGYAYRTYSKNKIGGGAAVVCETRGVICIK